MKPLFIPSRYGPLFCLYYPPQHHKITDAILHVPAFAEEMNKSRRMVALQARAFAAQGYAVLVPDLFGTGESWGDYGDATWETWLTSIQTAFDWLIKNGSQTIHLWGIRTGNLLAIDFAASGRGGTGNLISWQPVLNGDIFVTQFLRLRVAAAIMDNNAPREKTSDLKKQLLSGQMLEVAGYNLNPLLIEPLMALRADRADLQNFQEIAIFEVVQNEESSPSMANSQWLTHLKQQNKSAALIKIIGDPFWTTQEISEVPELIEQTSHYAAP